MDDLFSFFSIIMIVFGVLQIILFFKIWGMTNDIRALKNHFISTLDATSTPENKTSQTSSTGWTIAFIFGLVALIIILIIKIYI